MQPVPTYEALPVVFDTAPQTAIPNPTIDSGYGEGVALPTEHFSWLEYKVTKKIDELATSTLSLLGELDSYLSSRGVTPSGASVTQFQAALAAQIAGASVASAAACTGNAATATSAGQCTGNSTTASALFTARTIGGVSFNGSTNIDLPGVNILGNASNNFHGSIGGASVSNGSIYSAITATGAIPNVGDKMLVTGGIDSGNLPTSYATRTGASQIRLYCKNGLSIRPLHEFNAGDAQTVELDIAW